MSGVPSDESERLRKEAKKQRKAEKKAAAAAAAPATKSPRLSASSPATRRSPRIAALAEASVPSFALDSGADDEAQARAAKKARKAEKKKAETEVEAGVLRDGKHHGEAVQMEVDAETAAAEAKKKKKAEKKARKEAEAAATSAAPAAASSSSSSSSTHTPNTTPTAAASPMTAQRKNFYVQHKDVASMSAAAIAAVRAEFKMTLTGNMYGKELLYTPVTNFVQAGFSKPLLKCTEGFTAPTGIQSQCWPVLLMGRDAIAIAETGSGKTLGFVLPALVHILDAAPISTSKKGRGGDVSNMGPVALVLAPTRELAMQSAEVAEKAAAGVGLNTCCIYGGVDRHAQRDALSKGVHLMVATPGRLLSLMRDKEISLARVTFLVLDEADRMLDLGFEPDIRAIVAECPDSQRRQTLMFSATWPESVKKLADSFIVDPLRITIGKDAEEMASDTLAANKRITQHVEVHEDFKRDARLLQILADHTKGGGKDHKKILVFVLYKKEVGQVERLLRNKQFNVVGMSSDYSQADRVAALESFKSGAKRILVATDVAGRGLDINDIALVINYSFPLTIEDYVHRIGRTGRGGKSGEAITFFTKNDKGLSGELCNVLREAGQTVPEELMKFGTGVKRKAHGMYGAHFRATDDERPMKAAVKVTFD